MVSDGPLRSARLPAPPEVRELLDEPFARQGCVIEDVDVVAKSTPPRVVVVVDADDDHDEGLDLDALADLSRLASEVLDASDASGAAGAPGGDYAPYVLEVSSRGVDRPLTAPRHFRRARGRKAEVTLADGSSLLGRLGALTGDTVDVVVPEGGKGRYVVRATPLSEIARAVVQVEFSPPNRREIELAGRFGEELGE